MTVAQRFAVLGPVRAWHGTAPIGLGSLRDQALLAALLLRPDRTVGAWQLRHDVWGAESSGIEAAAVPAYVDRLRERLRPADGAAACRISDDGDGYRFAGDGAEVDTVRLETLAAEAHAARFVGDLDTAADTLTRALDLYDGLPLTGLPGPFAEAERLRLAERRITLAQEKQECRLGLGRYAEALTELTELTAQHPRREPVAALLMRALYGTGRQAEALAVYAEVSARLLRNRAAPPGDELRRVHAAVRRRDDAFLLGGVPARHGA